MSRALRILVAATLVAGAGLPMAAQSAPPPWKDVPVESVPLVGARLTAPLRLRAFEMDPAAIEPVLAGAPLEGLAGARLPHLSLPMPDGTAQTFLLARTDVMHPQLAAKFPQIRTFAGAALNAPHVTGRFQMDPRGFRGMIFTPQGTVYIDPYTRGDARHYQSYFKHDLPARVRPVDQVLTRRSPASLAVPSVATAEMSAEGMAAAQGASAAGDLRTYRLAMAATWQYSRFHDPQTPPAEPRKSVVMAEIVNVVNRVNGVYQRDLGIRLQLVPNNENAIYTTPVQPYSDAEGVTMVYTNTLILDQNIGNENYDIGHVASTGGGGIAGLGVVCNAERKGDGVTGLPQPVGDAYYIDFVAHEMGHQFGANHTFNGSETTNCDPNRNASTAYEPGSGVTVMGYAGVCGSQNLAPHSIDTFHGASIDEILLYSREGEGNDCAAITQIGNTGPEVTAGTGGFTIPRKTAFELTGAACDADGDALSYQWEQFDLGATSEPPDSQNSTGPIFRNFDPTPSPTRMFPALSTVLGGAAIKGEVTPNVSRELNFRLTVRDSNVSAPRGGVGNAALKFNVTAAAGPFVITSHNSPAGFQGLQATTVTWDVAGTTAPPVSCAAVDILFSADNGTTFPHTLAAATPNDGTQQVTLPNVATAAGRIKVKCATNVFLDINNASLTVTPVVTNTAPVADAGADQAVDEGTLVTLSGAGSSDPDAGDVLAYAWTQTGGPEVTLSDAGAVGPTFTAPEVETDTPLTFQLTVTDNAGASSADSVVVTVRNVVQQAVTPFSFIERTGVATNAWITSEGVGLSGFTMPLQITVAANGQYRVNDGAWTSAAGQVNPGDTLRVRHVSAGTAGTATETAVTVGTYSTTFRSVTSSVDRTPDAFTFGTKTNVVGGAEVESDPVEITGFNTDIAIVPGPGIAYSLDGGATWSSTSGTLPYTTPWTTVTVRHVATTQSRGYTKTYLRVGGVTGYFTTRTR
jgi:hypothetical protein